MGDMHYRVRAEGRNDPPPEAGLPQPRMVSQIRGRRVGCRDELDLEAVQQVQRSEGGVVQREGERVIQPVGGLRARLDVDTEDLDQLVLEPVAGRGAPEEVPACAEAAPDGA